MLVNRRGYKLGWRRSGIEMHDLGQARVSRARERHPRRAARAILAALYAFDMPLRLALGADTVVAIRAKHERLRADLDERESVSRATAFD